MKHFLLILLLATAAHGQTQARICWETKNGGIHWCSEPYSFKTAEAWVKLSNRDWADSIFAYTEILPDELPFSDHLRFDAIDSQPLAPLWTALGQESKPPKPHPGDDRVKMLQEQEEAKILDVPAVRRSRIRSIVIEWTASASATSNCKEMPSSTPSVDPPTENCPSTWRATSRGWECAYWTCADKSRFLLTAEDETRHCIKFSTK